MKKRIAIDLEGTLIDNARSIELQKRVKTSGDDWYLVTAHADPLAVEDIVREAMNDLDCQLVFEPGRVIAGNAGILVTKVLYQLL